MSITELQRRNPPGGCASGEYRRLFRFQRQPYSEGTCGVEKRKIRTKLRYPKAPYDEGACDAAGGGRAMRRRTSRICESGTVEAAFCGFSFCHG